MIKTIHKKLLLSLISGAMLVSVAPMLQAADDTSAIEKRLQTIIPNDASKAQITATPVPGLYQIQIGMTVVYMSKDGKYLVNGNVVDLESNKNLTKETQAKTRKLALKKIPENTMIVYPAKGGKDKAKHTITVFSDIDCPYCSKLHKEIPALNDAGVNVRYLSYPRAGMGSPSYHKAVSVWCAENPAKSMDDAMAGLPPESKQCKNPVRDHMIQAELFEVNGTPNIILDNGELLPGYVPAKKLITILNQP
jgi:thiol:disulfide interchange protein DsbC